MNYLEVLKITIDKSGENIPHLKITELVLVHCNIANNRYQPDSRVLSLVYITWSITTYFTKKMFLKFLHILKYGLLIKILNHKR